MNIPSGSPIRTLIYSVVRADALAYTMLRHELTWREKLRLLVPIAGAGLLAGLLPPDMHPAMWWSVAGALLLVAGAGAVLWTNIDVRRRAARVRLPEGPVRLEQWPDRLVERSADATREVPMTAIAQVIRTEAHVFVRVADMPLIVPRAAFADETEMRAFADGIDAASDRAQP